MNKQFTGLAGLLAAALLTPTAQADDFAGPYLGMALSGPGRVESISRSGARIESDHSGIGVRLHGGYRINQRFAVEAGYSRSATHMLRDTGTGVAGDARIAPSSLYVAGKVMFHPAERVALFGKLGVVHSRFDFSWLGIDDVKINRALVGVGAEYSVTSEVGLTLELTRYGETRFGTNGHLRLNKLEAGVNWRF